MYNSGYGRSIMAFQVTASGIPSHFTTSQSQVNLITIIGSAGKIGFSFRLGAYNVQAASRYGINALSGPWNTVYVDFTVDAITTAGLLKTAIDALSLDITVDDNGDGTLTISSGSIGILIQYKGNVQVSNDPLKETFDMATYKGATYLVAQVNGGGSIRYSESSTPTTLTGFLVQTDGTFNIYSQKGILKSLFIEETATANIDYEIFI